MPGKILIQNIIWDWNGTLLDDLDLCVGLINTILREFGRQTMGVDVYRELFCFPVIDYYRRIQLDTSPEGFARISRKFISGYNMQVRSCSLHSDVRSFLTRCLKQQIPQAILSAARHDHLEDFVGHFGIRGMFQRVQGIGDIYASGKIESGRKLIRDLDWNPSKTLLIGDTSHDLEVAHDLGLHCLLVSRGHESRSRLLATGAPVVDSLSDQLLDKSNFFIGL